MTVKPTLAALALASLCVASAHAQTVAPLTFAERLAQAGVPLTVGPEGFSGPGAAILSDAIDARLAPELSASTVLGAHDAR